MSSYMFVHKITYCLHVERLCYVHNVDTFNAMSKESKDYTTHHTTQCYVYWSMPKGSKVEITVDPSTYIVLDVWKGLSLSFPKLFSDWKSVEY